MFPLLGAPNETFYDRINDVCVPASSHWGSPDWAAFDAYLEMGKPITLPCKRLIKIILSFQEYPVPSQSVELLMRLFGSTTTSPSCIDEETLLIATKNISTEQETMLQLFKHISKNRVAGIECFVREKLMHECAKVNNINVAKAIVEKYPAALNSCNQLGLRPIHVAFSYQHESTKRSDMVKLLLKEGSKHGVDGTGGGCGGVFLQRQKSGLGSNGSNVGGSPIELALYYLRQKYARDKDDIEDEWKCVEVCVEVIKESIKDFQFINHIIGLNVGMERLIRDIVKRFDIDLNHPDSDGMTPLLAAIKERKTSYIKSLLMIQNCANELIQHCEINGNCYKNCLPLHIAVNEGISWTAGLKEIYESNPNASGNLDPTTGLFTFMVAAQWKENPLDDVYNLLQSNPGVAESCVIRTHLPHLSSFLKYKHFIVIVIIGVIIQCYYFASTD